MTPTDGETLDAVRFLQSGEAAGTIALRIGENPGPDYAARHQQLVDMKRRLTEMPKGGCGSARREPPGAYYLEFQGQWRYIGPGFDHGMIKINGAQYKLKFVYLRGMPSYLAYNATFDPRGY